MAKNYRPKEKDTTLQGYISRLGKHFKLFNVIDGVEYVLVKFPDKWEIPSNKGLSAEFGVQTANDKQGTYFYSEVDKGIGPLFEAVLYTVKYNRTVEEKISLLKAKVEELKELFAEEPLSRLKSLRFVMDDDIPTAILRKKNKQTVTRQEPEDPDINLNEDDTETDTFVTDEEDEVEQAAEPTIEEKTEEAKDEGSLLDMAISMAGEKTVENPAVS